MCGLAGILSPRAIDDATVRAAASMNAALAARGPDGEGLARVGRCVLTHRRLAIRDAVGGRQPFASPCGRVHLVFNGELYDVPKLRQAVTEASGYVFATDPINDVETLLAAYLAWGVDCLPRLQGMFALAIYDGRSERLLLARDRCGIKPLFYATPGGSLAFASTAAALLEHPNVSRSPDFAALSHYLGSFRLTLGRRTLYDGIRQLCAGERLVAEGGRVRLERWADWPICPHDDVGPDRPDADLARSLSQELETRLAAAVSRRLVADVPVGLFLSGGVDSALLASLLRERRGAGTFALASGEHGGEELRAAAATAAATGCELETVLQDEADTVRTWEHLLGETRLPLATPSDIAIHQLARTMRPHAGVVLGGEGADELLGGYALPHFSARDYRLATQARAVKPSQWPGFVQSLHRATGRTTFASLLDHFLHVNSLVPPAAKSLVLTDDVWQAAGADEPVRAYYKHLLDGGGAPERRVYRALLSVNLEGQLSRLDSSTMLAGLEARVPYCDGELIDRMAVQPWRMHLGLKPGTSQPFRAAAELAGEGAIESKRLLRLVAARRLPHAIATRPKASFPTPLAGMLGGSLASEVQSLLSRSRFARQIFRREARAGWIADPAAAGMTLWPVVNLVRWGEREFYGGSAETLGGSHAFDVKPPERRLPRVNATVAGGGLTQSLRAIR